MSGYPTVMDAKMDGHLGCKKIGNAGDNSVVSSAPAVSVSPVSFEINTNSTRDCPKSMVHIVIPNSIRNLYTKYGVSGTQGIHEGAWTDPTARVAFIRKLQMLT